jgi:hypothetical protein
MLQEVVAFAEDNGWSVVEHEEFDSTSATVTLNKPCGEGVIRALVSAYADHSDNADDIIVLRINWLNTG